MKQDNERMIIYHGYPRNNTEKNREITSVMICEIPK